MKAERIDKYKEDYSSIIDVKTLIKYIIYQLDEFIEYIQKNHDNILDSYIEKLEDRYDKVLVDSGEEYNYFAEYEKTIELDAIHKFPKLLEKYRKIIEFSFNLTKYNAQPESDKFEISEFDRFKGSKIPLYLSLQALAETIPRNDAIKIYKEFTDVRTTPPKNMKPSMTSVDDMVELYRNTFPNTHVYSLFKLEEGKAVCRIDRCMIVEALESFDKNLDTEIAYLTACINDYGHARMVNKNFTLTREKTIMEHDEYCDFCWHDKSIQKEITHPDQEFWNKL